MVTRGELIREARGWLGTPFEHQGRVRGVGVDCAGFVLCVLRDLGLGDWLGEFEHYSAQPVGEEVLAGCREHLIEKGASGCRAGDVLVFRAPVAPVHLALVTDAGIIHAVNAGRRLPGGRQGGRVIEHGLGVAWRKKIAACFAVPGIL